MEMEHDMTVKELKVELSETFFGYDPNRRSIYENVRNFKMVVE
jgi:hypothetical protein